MYQNMLSDANNLTNAARQCCKCEENMCQKSPTKDISVCMKTVLQNRPMYMWKETLRRVLCITWLLTNTANVPKICVKRALQKRCFCYENSPTKETYACVKRDLQNRPMNTDAYVERELQKRTMYTRKELSTKKNNYFETTVNWIEPHTNNLCICEKRPAKKAYV